MKLWELNSYFRSESAKLKRVINDPKWVALASHFRNFTQMVQRQNRAVLDMQLPNELCREALSLTDRIYTDHGGNLVEITGNPRDPLLKVLTALQVFDLYGGEYLEEVQEYGSCRLPQAPAAEQAIAIVEAVKVGNLMAAKKLSENVDFRRNRALGSEAFGWAVEMGHFVTADWLLSRGVDINAYNARSETVLWQAVESGNLKVVTYLLEHGASVNAVSPDGDTILHCSIDMEVEEAIAKTDELKRHCSASDELTRLLVQRGAKVWVKNKKGEMSIDWALQKNHVAAEKFLRECQAHLGAEELIAIVPTRKKQAFAALCLAQFCMVKKINHAPVRQLIEHLLSVLVTTDLVKWDGAMCQLVPPIWPSIKQVLPPDVSKGEFRELVDAVTEVGMSNMYTGASDGPLEGLRWVIKILNKFAVPIPSVEPDFYLRGNQDLSGSDGWGRNVDSETYQKMWNAYRNIARTP